MRYAIDSSLLHCLCTLVTGGDDGRTRGACAFA
jgi:hypothetical protein